jgi:hypothetical protein
MHKAKLRFQINNDLSHPKWNKHNRFHVWFTAVLTVVLPGYFTGYLCMLVWELGDGFKPWWYTFKYDPSQSVFVNRLRENFLYSDKFSLQDVFYWNILGFIIGTIIKVLICR